MRDLPHRADALELCKTPHVRALKRWIRNKAGIFYIVETEEPAAPEAAEPDAAAPDVDQAPEEEGSGEPTQAPEIAPETVEAAAPEAGGEIQIL